MKIFELRKIVELQLEPFTMDQVMNFPEVNNTGLEEFYLKDVFSANHVQIGVVQGRIYTSGIHDFRYDTSSKQIHIFSRFRPSAFFVYSFLFIPLLGFLSLKETNSTWILGVTFALFVLLTLLLLLGIRSESKKIEREMIIRVDFLRRNKIRN